MYSSGMTINKENKIEKLYLKSIQLSNLPNLGGETHHFMDQQGYLIYCSHYSLFRPISIVLYYKYRFSWKSENKIEFIGSNALHKQKHFFFKVKIKTGKHNDKIEFSWRARNHVWSFRVMFSKYLSSFVFIYIFAFFFAYYTLWSSPQSQSHAIYIRRMKINSNLRLVAFVIAFFGECVLFFIFKDTEFTGVHEKPHEPQK